MVDLYRPILAKALFPAFEAIRGRPTVPLLRYVKETERWSLPQIRDVQAGFLLRLVRHAYRHTAYYRDVMDERGLLPEDFDSVDALSRLPLLDRKKVHDTLDARTATAGPPATVIKTTSGSSGTPVTVKYTDESRHWRDAMRWRGYGWAGYEIGMRAFHYWGAGPKAITTWWKTQKANFDHRVKRDMFVDCTPRDDASLADAVAQLRRYRPHVIVAYATGAAALAKFVNDRALRDWGEIPVLTGAEALTPAGRAEIERAFGPVYETYGCREVMLIGAECEAHEGMHTSMENMIVELIVEEPDGTVRHARPGESGVVTVTDLHNLACPMIRYTTGDRAIAHDGTPCSCGRSLAKLGPIDGRVTETFRTKAGQGVSGIVFNVALAYMGDVVKDFQVVQYLDDRVEVKLVLWSGGAMPAKQEQVLRELMAKYFPGTPFLLSIVESIPLTSMGKRRPIVVEKPV